MEDMGSLGVLEDALGYRFRHPELLLEALTHRSYAHEQKFATHDNERLEFLGDSILGLLVSDSLFRQRPNLTEGQLSRLKAYLVSAANLVRYADQIHLGQYLRLGKGEHKNGGRGKRTLLVDAFEAVIAAVYVDGGIDSVRNLISRFFSRQIQDLAETADQLADFKSELQERLQARGGVSVDYRLLEETGPDHQKLFTVEARIDGQPLSVGSGLTKKAAEQAAAMRALESLTGGSS